MDLGRKSENRVLRGGSWNNNGRWCRSANRNGNHPGNRNDNIGFRLSRAQQGRTALLTRPLSCPLANFLRKDVSGETQTAFRYVGRQARLPVEGLPESFF